MHYGQSGDPQLTRGSIADVEIMIIKTAIKVYALHKGGNMTEKAKSQKQWIRELLAGNEIEGPNKNIRLADVIYALLERIEKLEGGNMPKNYTETQKIIHTKLGLNSSLYIDKNIELQDIFLAIIARMEVIEKRLAKIKT